MKKLVTILLTLAMVLGLAACGGNADQPANTNPGSDSTQPPASEQPNNDLDYPTKTINVIVPFAAGGGTDVLARAVAKSMADLGYEMIITNMEGGGSSVGALESLYAEPDGYTILCLPFEAILAGAYGGTYNDENVFEKFSLLCSLADDAQILLASKASGYTELDQIIEAAQANPGEVTCAGPGSFSTTNASAVELFGILDTDISYVPFEGDAKTRAAVMGGHTDLCVISLSAAAVAIESGDVVPICVLSADRSEFYPDVPSINELIDYDEEIDIVLHRGYELNCNVPEEIIQALGDAFEEVAASEETQETLRSLYFAPKYIGADELTEIAAVRAEKMREAFDVMNAAK